MQEVNFEQAIEQIRAKDSRYPREAYHFVREALDYTKKHFDKQKRKNLHVSGQELLDGIRNFGLAEFGPMAMTVFEEWGIKSCEDFGEIVFNMVEIGLLATTEKDSRKDFEGGYEFWDAFRKPFVPPSRRVKTAASPPRLPGVKI